MPSFNLFLNVFCYVIMQMNLIKYVTSITACAIVFHFTIFIITKFINLVVIPFSETCCCTETYDFDLLYISFITLDKFLYNLHLLCHILSSAFLEYFASHHYIFIIVYIYHITTHLFHVFTFKFTAIRFSQ